MDRTTLAARLRAHLESHHVRADRAATLAADAAPMLAVEDGAIVVTTSAGTPLQVPPGADPLAFYARTIAARLPDADKVPLGLRPGPDSPWPRRDATEALRTLTGEGATGTDVLAARLGMRREG